jgi:hypothetical protein
MGRDHLGRIDVDGKINIRMNLREIGWEGAKWIHMAEEGTTKHSDETSGSLNGGEFLTG